MALAEFNCTAPVTGVFVGFNVDRRIDGAVCDKADLCRNIGILLRFAFETESDKCLVLVVLFFSAGFVASAFSMNRSAINPLVEINQNSGDCQERVQE